MNIISHGLAGFILIFILAKITNLNPNITPAFLIIYFFISIIPDVSGLWTKQLKHHHRDFFHAPILWISILIFGIILKLNFVIIATSLLIFHLVCDFITARTTGIMLFYPFSKKENSLIKTHPRWGKVSPVNLTHKDYGTFAKHYFQNKELITFEFIMILLGTISLIKII